jgi:hypothetical protein
MPKEIRMIVANRKGFRHRGLAAITAAVIFTTVAVVSVVPAWAVEETSTSKAAAAGEADAMASRRKKNDISIPGHGFVASHGVFTTIDAPGGQSTVVTDIDDSGRTVGFSATVNSDGTRTIRGFLRDAQGGFTPIDVPNGVATGASDINNRGQIVGSYLDDVRRPGFLLSNGVFTTLTIPGAFENAIAVGINDQGRIVGLSF